MQSPKTGKETKNKEECQTTKQLVIIISDFLLTQSERNVSKTFTSHLRSAVKCLEKVYSIRVTDYLQMRHALTLPELYERASNSVSIKDRQSAERCKELGNKLMGKKLYHFAEEEYDRAIGLNQYNAVYFCNRATAKIHQLQYTSAITDCHKALSLDSEYAKAHARLGQAHYLMCHPSEAAKHFKKALKIEPYNVTYRRCLDHAVRLTEDCDSGLLTRLKCNLLRLSLNLSSLGGGGPHYSSFSNRGNGGSGDENVSILNYNESLD